MFGREKIFLKVLGIVQPKAVNKKTLQLKTGKTNHKKGIREGGENGGKALILIHQLKKCC